MSVHMKFKKAKILSITLLALTLLASCGKKNVVNSKVADSGGYTGINPNLNTGGDVNASQLGSIINQISCTQGTRLNNVYTYQLSGSGTLTTIYGSFTPGQISGPIRQIYVGKSSYGDVMLVAKITNGSSVVGYNVYLSYCSQNSNSYPLISDQRPMANFQAPRGITITDPTTTGYGVVSAAETIIIAQGISYQSQWGGSIQLPQYQVYTYFRP